MLVASAANHLANRTKLKSKTSFLKIMSAQLAGLDAQTVDVVWCHPRGTSLGSIITNYSAGTDKGPNRGESERVAKRRAEMACVLDIDVRRQYVHLYVHA